MQFYVSSLSWVRMLILLQYKILIIFENINFIYRR
jgi:hypothetical protein